MSTQETLDEAAESIQNQRNANGRGKPSCRECDCPVAGSTPYCAEHLHLLTADEDGDAR